MNYKSLCYRVNYIWRLLATGLYFFIFSVGGLILSAIVFPALGLLVRDKVRRKKSARYIIRCCFRSFLWALHYSGILKFKGVGLEALENDRGVVIVANHPTLIDVIVLMAVAPNVNCVVKKALLKSPFLGGVVSAAGYIPNDGPENILNLCKESLSRGENLIIFPEGTRSVPGEPLLLRRGAARVAFHSGASLRPIKITVTPPMLTKSKPWYGIPKKRALFLVQVQDLMSTNIFIKSRIRPSIAVRRITSEIKVNIDPALPLL